MNYVCCQKVLHFLTAMILLTATRGRFIIDTRPTSHPILFDHDSDTDAHLVNATILLKKKGGPVWRPHQQSQLNLSNHQQDELWEKLSKRPDTRFTTHEWWTEKPFSYPTMGPIADVKRTENFTIDGYKTTRHPYINKQSLHSAPNRKTLVINNHKSFGSQTFYRPRITKPPSSHYNPFATVTIVDKQLNKHEVATDILGDRLKHPDTITSTWVKVLDPPSDRKTTVKHDKLIVIQKRMEPQTQIKKSTAEVVPATTVTVTSKPLLAIDVQIKPSKPPGMYNFSMAPVMDPWSNIAIPSRPAWAAAPPVKGSSSQTTSSLPMFSGIPFMPFLSSLITPLLNKPLTPGAVNTGIQGIKAMQGFLRNSLMGAMFCFLPSAFIALSLSATQRAQLRKTSEMDDMMLFCKKCLENLKLIKKFTRDQPGWWKDMMSDLS